MSFRRFAPGTQAHPTQIPLRGGVRTRRVAGSVAMLAVVAGSFLVGPAASPAAAAPVAIAATPRAEQAEAQLLWQINADRARAGLWPLALNRTLSDGASAWSTWMAAHGQLFHHPDLRSVAWQAQPGGWSAIGENVGVGPDGIRLHQQFMGSRSHAAHVYGNYTSIGIGAVESGGRIWVTVRFLR